MFMFISCKDFTNLFPFGKNVFSKRENEHGEVLHQTDEPRSLENFFFF